MPIQQPGYAWMCTRRSSCVEHSTGQILYAVLVAAQQVSSWTLPQATPIFGNQTTPIENTCPKQDNQYEVQSSKATKKVAPMRSMKDIQNIQLHLIESASTSESCASDLLDILHKLNHAEAISIRSIIEQLRHEARILRALSKTFVNLN